MVLHQRLQGLPPRSDGFRCHQCHQVFRHRRKLWSAENIRSHRDGCIVSYSRCCCTEISIRYAIEIYGSVLCFSTSNGALGSSLFYLYKQTSWYTELVYFDDGSTGNSEAPSSSSESLGTAVNNEGKSSSESLLDVKEEESSKTTRARSLLNFFHNTDVIVLTSAVFVSGIQRCVALQFLFLIMKDEMSASQTAMGLAQGVGCFSQAFVLLFSRNINTNSRINNNVVSIEVGIFAWCFILLSTAFIKNQWLAVLPQLLHGISIGLFQVATVSILSELSPKNIYITLFTVVFGVVYFGAAGFIGSTCGGLLYHRYGGPVTFLYTCAFSGSSLFFMMVYFHGRTLVTTCRFGGGLTEYNNM